jgi:hypothetical protein
VFHYGWVGGVRTGNEFDAFAWGYETLPDTPIEAGAGGDEPICPADIADSDSADPDGEVNVFDLLELLSNWNTNGPGANIAEPADDVVNVFDLLALLAAWGSCE